MKITAFIGVLAGAGALALRAAAQDPVCSGENTGIDHPYWRIEYAWQLQKAMCGSIYEEDRLSDDEPYATRSLILDGVTSLDLHAWVPFIGEVFCNDTTVGGIRAIRTHAY
jgi:hypothetical protein